MFTEIKQPGIAKIIYLILQIQLLKIILKKTIFTNDICSSSGYMAGLI